MNDLGEILICAGSYKVLEFDFYNDDGSPMDFMSVDEPCSAYLSLSEIDEEDTNIYNVEMSIHSERNNTFVCELPSEETIMLPTHTLVLKVVVLIDDRLYKESRGFFTVIKDTNSIEEISPAGEVVRNPLSVTCREVIDARTDTLNITHENLKQRLDQTDRNIYDLEDEIISARQKADGVTTFSNLAQRLYDVDERIDNMDNELVIAQAVAAHAIDPDAHQSIRDTVSQLSETVYDVSDTVDDVQMEVIAARQMADGETSFDSLALRLYDIDERIQNGGGSGVGENVEGKEYSIDGDIVIAKTGAERFNDIHNVVTGTNSHAEGEGVLVTGNISHAEGYCTKASSWYSHAEGNGTTASGESAHAEGYCTTASGNASHAEGYNTTASEYYSHAEGYYTMASRWYSHAEGEHTKALSECQHVQGKYNIEDESGLYAHIVGNGTDDDARSNAHTLDWSGNAWFAGDVIINGNTSLTEALANSGGSEDERLTQIINNTEYATGEDKTLVVELPITFYEGGTSTFVSNSSDRIRPYDRLAVNRFTLPRLADYIPAEILNNVTEVDLYIDFTDLVFEYADAVLTYSGVYENGVLVDSDNYESDFELEYDTELSNNNISGSSPADLTGTTYVTSNIRYEFNKTNIFGQVIPENYSIPTDLKNFDLIKRIQGNVKVVGDTIDFEKTTVIDNVTGNDAKTFDVVFKRSNVHGHSHNGTSITPEYKEGAYSEIPYIYHEVSSTVSGMSGYSIFADFSSVPTTQYSEVTRTDTIQINKTPYKTTWTPYTKETGSKTYKPSKTHTSIFEYDVSDMSGFSKGYRPSLFKAYGSTYTSDDVAGDVAGDVAVRTGSKFEIVTHAIPKNIPKARYTLTYTENRAASVSTTAQRILDTETNRNDIRGTKINLNYTNEINTLNTQVAKLKALTETLTKQIEDISTRITDLH